MKYLMILVFFISSIASASDPVYLYQNDKAPFAGYLIDSDTATAARNNKIDLEATKKILTLTQDENKILEQRINNANSEIDRVSKQLTSERDSSFLSKAGFFVLGAVITGFVAYGTTRLIK